MGSPPNTGTTMVTIFSGNPNGIVQGNQGDVVSDPVTPAIWQATGAGYSTIWTQGSGGSGSQGPQGPQGAPGAQGAQGAAGANGAQGPQGTAGSNGAQGAQGAQGPGGSTGPQGAAGATGATGPQGPIGALQPPPQSVQLLDNSGTTVLSIFEIAPPALPGYSQVTLLSSTRGTGTTAVSSSFTPVSYQVLIANLNQVSSASSAAMTDTYGLTWHHCTGQPLASGSDCSDCWYAQVPSGYSGGAITVTATFNASGNSIMQITGVLSNATGVIQDTAGYSGATITETFGSVPLSSSVVVGALIAGIGSTPTSLQGLTALATITDAGSANIEQSFYIVGAYGVPGPQGAQGPQGATGAQGTQGPQGTQGTGSALIGYIQYEPSSEVTYNNSGASFAAYDATNLSVSFVAPTSGTVLVRLTARCQVTSGYGYFGLLDHTSHSQYADSAMVTGNISGSPIQTFSVPIVVSGLTAGTTYQFDWAGLGTGLNLFVQGAAGAPGTAYAGPAIMEVWAQGAIAGTQGAQGPPGWPATVAAVAVSSNAATVAVTAQSTAITNNAAGSVAITLTTSGAVDGQSSLVRFYDHSAASQTLSWVNTENSLVTVPTASNGSTTLPLTVGFIYNGVTSKWRCVAVV